MCIQTDPIKLDGHGSATLEKYILLYRKYIYMMVELSVSVFI